MQALHVVLGPVAIDGKAVSDVRKDVRGIDQGGEKFRWDLMADVGQSDENTVALFDEGGYVRVPGEVLVEHYAKVPHPESLTHHVLAEPNSDGSQFETILTGATNQKFSFASIYF